MMEKFWPKKRTDEERFADGLGEGELKMGFTRCYLSPSSLDERYKFVVPVRADDIGVALDELVRMLAALDGSVRNKLQFRVVMGGDAREKYGNGMCAMVIEEHDYHYMSEGRAVERALKKMGGKLTDEYTPEKIKSAFKLLVSRRNSEDSIEDDWYSSQYSIARFARRA